MNNYEFTINVDGLNIENLDQIGKLAETPEEIFILPSTIGRSQYLSCEISANTPNEAIRALYRFLAKTCPEIKLNSIVPDLDSPSEITELLDLPLETICK